MCSTCLRRFFVSLDVSTTSQKTCNLLLKTRNTKQTQLKPKKNMSTQMWTSFSGHSRASFISSCSLFEFFRPHSDYIRSASVLLALFSGQFGHNSSTQSAQTSINTHFWMSFFLSIRTPFCVSFFSVNVCAEYGHRFFPVRTIVCLCRLVPTFACGPLRV